MREPFGKLVGGVESRADHQLAFAVDESPAGAEVASEQVGRYVRNAWCGRLAGCGLWPRCYASQTVIGLIDRLQLLLCLVAQARRFVLVAIGMPDLHQIEVGGLDLFRRGAWLEF